MLGHKRSVFFRTMLQGHSGEDVRQLQELLRSAGFEPGDSDGNFGPMTRSAVVAFQRSVSLEPDGAVGPLTLAALVRAAAHEGAPEGKAATGLSLHVGLNRVDDNAYGFPVPPLAGCINDASDMRNIASGMGFRHRILMDNQATSSAIISSIEEAAQKLYSGDILMITYAGHGSQVPDPSEPDGRSETWVLWDRQLIDNELYALWGKFRAGVRVLVVSDSCHSGTVTRFLGRASTALIALMGGQRRGVLRDAEGGALEPVNGLMRDAVRELFAPQIASTERSWEPVQRPRLLDERLAFQDAVNRAGLYKQERSRTANSPAPACDVLLLAACQDNQTASDGFPDPSGHQNGAFTRALRNYWELSLNYADLHARILRDMPSSQTPNKYWATPRNAAFAAQRPFAI
jgi:metacaspase-1